MSRFANVFKADIRNVMRLQMLAAILLVPPLILMDSAYDLQWMFQPMYSVYYFYMDSIMTGGLYGTYLVGMLCAIPYARAFCAEVRMNMAPSVIVRSGERNYFVSKFLTASLAGGSVSLLGMLILFVGLRAVGLPLFSASSLDGMESSFYFSHAFQRPVVYFLIALYYAFLNGALLAGLATWISCYVQNEYVVVSFPAVVLFAEVQVARLFQIPGEWRLDLWLKMRATVVNEATTMWLSLAAVVLILSLCAWNFARRGRVVMGYA